MVLNGRRLVPLGFLLLLLVFLSVYDNFRVDRAVGVMEEVKVENQISYYTTDQGKKKVEPRLRLALNQEEWKEIARSYNLELPEYPFNPHGEAGVFIANGKIKYVQALPWNEDQVEVRVTVEVKDNYYHLALVEKRDFYQEGKQHLWVLMDTRGKVYEEVKHERTDKHLPETIR